MQLIPSKIIGRRNRPSLLLLPLLHPPNQPSNPSNQQHQKSYHLKCHSIAIPPPDPHSPPPAITTTIIRIKVRFVKKGQIQGRITKKIKWYGGVISSVINNGRRVRIKYDDGTDEVTEFPDKDIIVDDGGNGVHRGDAGAFVEDSSEESEEEEEEENALVDSPTPEKRKKKKKLVRENDNDKGGGNDKSDGSSEDSESEKNRTVAKKKRDKFRKKEYKNNHEEDSDLLDSDHSIPRVKCDSFTSKTKHEDKFAKELLRRANAVDGRSSKHDVVVENNADEKSGEDAIKSIEVKGASDGSVKDKVESQSPPTIKSPVPTKENVSLPSPPFEKADDKAPSSSSSGSTCSITSFGVVSGDNIKKEKKAAGVIAESSMEKPTDDGLKPEVAIEMVDDASKKQSSAEEQNSKPSASAAAAETAAAPSGTPVKKHRPLSIKISLPKRKRPEQEGKATPRPAAENIEPAKKKSRQVECDASEMPESKPAASDVLKSVSECGPKETMQEPYTVDLKSSNDHNSASERESQNDESKDVKVRFSIPLLAS